MNCRCDDGSHDAITALWHGVYCRWYDHDRGGRKARAATWGWIADRIVRWVR